MGTADQAATAPSRTGGAVADPPGRMWARVGVFTVVAFLAAGVLGALQPATGIPTEIVQLTQFGPALGVCVVVATRLGRMREVLGAGAADRAGPAGPARPAGAVRRVGAGGRARKAAALLATAPLITVLAVFAYAILTGGFAFTRPGALHHPFPLIAVAQLLGACGEEIGWRCLLQPQLRTRFGPIAASVAVGVLWGVWHVQVFAQAPAYAAMFLLATVSMSVVLGLALEHAGAYRLPLAGGFHALVNLGLLLFMDEESGAVVPMTCFGIACLIAAVSWARRAAVAADMSGASDRLVPITKDVRRGGRRE